VRRRPPGKYHHGSLATDAVEAAAREIDRAGHHGFTLQFVAKRLGVTAPALYRHFASREALLKEVVWQTFRRFVAEMDGAVGAAKAPRDAMLALGNTYVSFALRNPGWFRLQFSRDGMALEIDHTAAQPQYAGIIFNAIGTLLRTRDAERLETTYLSLWALAHGVASLALEGAWMHLKTAWRRRSGSSRLSSTSSVRRRAGRDGLRVVVELHYEDNRLDVWRSFLSGLARLGPCLRDAWRMSLRLLRERPLAVVSLRSRRRRSAQARASSST
jgi:AcrR family transcriptional regulator